jgi:polar amino acid transport system permease protein
MAALGGWFTIWRHLDLVFWGLLDTLAYFLLSSATAFVLACGLAYMLEGPRNLPRRALLGVMDLLRMSPFLIYLYLIYYGLPSLGIRLDAWVSGFVALVTYHAAYFGEILRAARATLPQGQVDAAKSHGYMPAGMYRRILLPQMVLRSGPLFGNQLIGCLKDTAFLSIITVFELTAAATQIQNTYFVPMPAFIVVIILYWGISLCFEFLLKRLDRVAILRGLSHG